MGGDDEGGERGEGEGRGRSSFRHIVLVFEDTKDVCYVWVKSKSDTQMVVSAKAVLKNSYTLKMLTCKLVSECPLLPAP